MKPDALWSAASALHKAGETAFAETENVADPALQAAAENALRKVSDAANIFHGIGRLLFDAERLKDYTEGRLVGGDAAIKMRNLEAKVRDLESGSDR